MSSAAANTPPKIRVAIFGSFHRGYHILSNLLNDPEIMEKIKIVGVATDDPKQSFTSPSKRVWQYAHSDDDERMVENLASRHGIPVFKGRVKTTEFYDILKDTWKPDIVYMGTFGQLLDATIINTPRMGIFNTHPSDGEKWPSYVGPDPFEQMFLTRAKHCSIALHKVNERFDDGEFASFSQRVAIPYDILDNMQDIGKKVVHMHRITSPEAAALINTHLRTNIGLPLQRKKSYSIDMSGANPTTQISLH